LLRECNDRAGVKDGKAVESQSLDLQLRGSVGWGGAQEEVGCDSSRCESKKISALEWHDRVLAEVILTLRLMEDNHARITSS
jgi:hypothetical protein